MIPEFILYQLFSEEVVSKKMTEPKKYLSLGRMYKHLVPDPLPLSVIAGQRKFKNYLIDYPNTDCPQKIFYPYKKKNRFLFKENKPTNILDSYTNYSLPVVVDTEYVSSEFDNIDDDNEDAIIEPRRHVTSQFKALNSLSPYTFVHHDLIRTRLDDVIRHAQDDNPFTIIRHPTISPEHQAHIIPYLRLEGYDAHLRRDEKAHEKKDKRTYRYPFIDLKLYGHMVLVDLTQIFEGDFLDDLRKAFARKKIKMNRRLTASGWSSFVSMPWILKLGKLEFRINISFVDTLGIHGNATFKDVCNNTGVLLNVKDEMYEWKSKMDRAYFDIPELFDQYATEDLKGDEVLKNYDRDIYKIYQDLGIEEWYQPPKLTIGSTVNDLFEAKVCQFIGLEAGQSKKIKKEYLEKLTLQGSANYLKTLVQKNNNAYILAKCDGGRCRNAHPLRSSLKGILVDIDISGAYTTAMSSLLYPLGNPVLASFTNVLLKDFLKIHERKLVSGLWTARIQTRHHLSYEQSLIPSWFHEKKTIKCKKAGIRELNLHHKNDSESYHVTGEVDLDSGETKIFSQEILNGTLTYDLLDIIRNVWSPRQQEDFFNKVEILAVAFYPAPLQLETVSQVLQAQEESEGQGDFITTLQGMEVVNALSNHSWTTFPMGELFIDLFKVYRNRHPKNTPLNILYKLFANTTYGDAVSKYFETSNMIFGSNITARCRSIMYLMEIGLNLQGSITDGHVFDINRVLHRKNGKYLNSDQIC